MRTPADEFLALSGAALVPDSIAEDPEGIFASGSPPPVWNWVEAGVLPGPQLVAQCGSAWVRRACPACF